MNATIVVVVVTIRIIFFFQAEDGIRDLYVTGVQTCALPICTWRSTAPPTPRRPVRSRATAAASICCGKPRSEERRVGKECRSRGTSYHEKKKRTSSVRVASADSAALLTGESGSGKWLQKSCA